MKYVLIDMCNDNEVVETFESLKKAIQYYNDYLSDEELEEIDNKANYEEVSARYEGVGYNLRELSKLYYDLETCEIVTTDFLYTALHYEIADNLEIDEPFPTFEEFESDFIFNVEHGRIDYITLEKAIRIGEFKHDNLQE